MTDRTDPAANPVDFQAVSKVYVAGPMTGIEDFNYPAFNTAAARLRTAGFEVLNPAETDTRMGTTPGEQSWQWYMRHALRMLADADGVALLDGWERSRGATLEHRIARSLNLPTGTVGLWIEAYR